MKKSTIFGVAFELLTTREDGQKPDNCTRETVSLHLLAVSEVAFADI